VEKVKLTVVYVQLQYQSSKDMGELGQTDLSTSSSTCELLPYAPQSQDDDLVGLRLDESLAQVCSESASSDDLMNLYVERMQEATKVIFTDPLSSCRTSSYDYHVPFLVLFFRDGTLPFWRQKKRNHQRRKKMGNCIHL
jgi:hypothetical protein